jgi:hypothetical protein
MHHTAVVRPIDGVASDAIAREIERGMKTCHARWCCGIKIVQWKTGKTMK